MMMNPSPQLAFAWVVPFLLGPLALASATWAHAQDADTAPPPTNASSARWETIEISGNESFSDAMIKDELFARPEFLIAIHPFADGLDVPNVVKNLLVKGYHHHGFPDVSVEVQESKSSGEQRPDAAAWSIQVDEGPQVLCRDVRILGAHRIDVDRLTARLTKPFPPRDAVATFVYADNKVVTQWVDEDGDPEKLKDPVWALGEGVPFGDETRMLTRVTEALSDIGFSNTLTVARFEIDETQQHGTLIVDLIEEGQHDRAESIEIAGLNIDSREQVLAFLEISIGDEIDGGVTQEIGQRLWDSGRFEKQSVTFDAKKQTLKIKLVEISGLPPLDEALNENAKVLLKMSRWLGGMEVRGDDCEHQWVSNGNRARAIFSDEGAFFEIMTPDVDGAGEHMSVLIDHEHVFAHHSELKKTLQVRLQDEFYVVFSNRFFASPEPDKFLTGSTRLSGAVPRKKGHAVLGFNFVSSPSDWVPLAYKDNVEFERVGSELIVKHLLGQLRVDIETGKVNHWKTERGEIRLSPGLFTATRDAMNNQLAATSSVDATGGSLSVLAQYVFSEPVIRSLRQTFDPPNAETSQRVDPNLTSAMRKLVSGGLFSFVDVIHDWFPDSDASESFSIPIQITKPEGSKRKVAIELAARIALTHTHQFFDEDTWPSTLTREVALLCLGGTKFSSKVLPQLVRDEHTGPIGISTIVFIVKYFNAPEDIVQPISKVALSRLNPDAFAADVEQLTRIIPIDYITRLRNSFQSLTAEELDALANMVDNENWELVLRRIHAVGQIDHEGMSEAGFWYLVLHGPMESWLKK